MTASNGHKNGKSQSLVLYGKDERGKPRAACFAARDALLARKAAGLMGLTALPVASPQQIEVAAKLPVGRLYSSGRGLVPNVRGKLYERLLEAAGGGAPAGQNGGKSQKPGGPKSGSSPQWPAVWNDIDVGHVVIAQEDDKEFGWSEASVVRKNGDLLTLRWQLPPNKKLFTRHRLNLALMYPNGQGEPASKGLTTTVGGSSKTEPSKSGSPTQADAQKYPADWAQIDVGSLVLAKDDGPLQAWWEAVLIAKDGDSFTVQWRDYANLPTVARHRLKLGLICPVVFATAKAA
jgi:hypothetical protein